MKYLHAALAALPTVMAGIRAGRSMKGDVVSNMTAFKKNTPKTKKYGGNDKKLSKANEKASNKAKSEVGKYEFESDSRASFVVGLLNTPQCIRDLAKHGLTDDQLRWIYSNYNEEQLVASGWDKSSVPNSDGKDSTHLWSELDASCPNEEIMISGTADTFASHEAVFSRILAKFGDGEDHRDSFFGCVNENDCAMFVEYYPTGITFFATPLFEQAHSLDTTTVAVRSDALTFVVGLFDTDACIQKLASTGLSHDALRWIYTTYTEAELLASDWDSRSVPNSDGDDATHLWSELDASCPEEEIAISAIAPTFPLHDYLFGEILVDFGKGEDHREEIFLCDEEDDCAEFVEENPLGFTFFTLDRWEEAHSGDTLTVGDPIIPTYIMP